MLLRRVAGTIANLGDVDVHDLVIHVEVDEDGDRPSITVYYVTDQPPLRLALLSQ